MSPNSMAELLLHPAALWGGASCPRAWHDEGECDDGSDDSKPASFEACMRPLSPSPSPDSDLASRDTEEEPEPGSTLTSLPALLPACASDTPISKPAPVTRSATAEQAEPRDYSATAPRSDDPLPVGCDAVRAAILDLHCYGSGLLSGAGLTAFLDPSAAPEEGAVRGQAHSPLHRSPHDCEDDEPSTFLRILDDGDGPDSAAAPRRCSDGSDGQSDSWASILYHSSDDECMNSDAGDSGNEMPIRILPNIYTQNELDIIRAATAGTCCFSSSVFA